MNKIKYYEFLMLLVELFIAFLLITKGAEYVVTAIENVFSTRFQSIPDLFGLMKSLVTNFFTNIGLQEHPLLKIVLIIKVCIISAFTGLIIFHIVMQNMSDNTTTTFFLIFFKVVFLFLFITMGLCHTVSAIDSNTVFSFGELFSYTRFKADFKLNGLSIIFISGIAAYDIIVYAARNGGGFKKSAKPKETKPEQKPTP